MQLMRNIQLTKLPAGRQTTAVARRARIGETLRPAPRAMLQRAASCACGGSCPRCKAGHSDDTVPVIQRMPAVSAPDDAFEREADEVANRVMRTAAPAPGGAPRGSAGASDIRQARHDRLPASEPAGANLAAVPPIVHEVLRSSGEPLDTETRAFMEPRFGRDLSQVRIHTDAKAAQSARAVNARAYTVGRDLVFGAAEHAPSTAAGKSLLAHELVHTVQQGAAPALQTGGPANFESEGAHEGEVDGGRPQANRGVHVHAAGATLARQAATEAPVQFDLESCPPDWKDKVTAASEAARKWVGVALNKIGTMLTNPATDDLSALLTQTLLELHFKIGTKGREKTVFDDVSKVYQGFQTINAAFGKPLPITCETTSDKVALGWVPWQGPLGIWRGSVNIHLYQPWFLADTPKGQGGPTLQTETIIHEMAHRFAGKDDNAYEDLAKDKEKYANLSTSDAIDNADCYSAFAREITFSKRAAPAKSK
jgi:hypothetical protein